MSRRTWAVVTASALTMAGAIAGGAPVGATTPVVTAPPLGLSSPAGGIADGLPGAATSTGSFPTPIKHVIIFYQENHSFDNVLGALCVEIKRCDGATSGVLSTGATMPLRQSPDVVPGVQHDVSARTRRSTAGP